MAQSSYTWRGFSGDWSDPTNWNPTGVPNNGAAAIIGGTQPILIEYYETTSLRNFQMTNPNAELYMYGGAFSRQSGTEDWVCSGQMTVGFDANVTFAPSVGGYLYLRFDRPTSRLVLEPGAVATFSNSFQISSAGVVELRSLSGQIGARLTATVLTTTSELRVNAGAIANVNSLFAQRVTGS